VRRRRPSSRGGPVLALALALAAAVPVLAAEPQLEVHLQPRRFGVDDVAQLTVRISEPPADAAMPELGPLVNLEVVAGPSTGSEFTFVNGVASRAQTFSYVVRGLEPGPASVGPVTVTAGDLELSADAVTAEVVEGSVAPPRSRGRRPFSDPFAELMPRRAPPRVELVLRHVLGAREAVLGEPLVATVYLDSTVAAIDRFNWQTAPSYPGFWAQRVDSHDQVTPDVVEVDGTRFYRYPVLHTVLVPLKAGRIEVPAVSAAVGVRSWSVFDPGQMVEREAPVQVVEVAERPPAPDGFAGAVGELGYRAEIEPRAIDFGESAVVTVTLEGRGNLPLVEAPPRFPTCEGCDAYPPEESSRVTVDESGIHGARSWQVTIVPDRSGELVLEPVTLAVFDPRAGRYRSQTIGPLALTVAPPPATPTPVAAVVPAGPTGVDGGDGDDDGGQGPSRPTPPPWLWPAAALAVGLVLGGGLTWALTRRRRTALPPRRVDQSPAERARELQVTLERWWLDVRATSRGGALEDEMQALRRDLEAVRFAPGRADHTETVVDLEARLRRLMRRA
jgi:hypothetical protein